MLLYTIIIIMNYQKIDYNKMSNTGNNDFNALTQQHHIIIIGDKAKTTKQNSHKWLHAALTAQRKSYTILVLFPLLLTKFRVITLTNTAAKILIYAKINCEQFVQRWQQKQLL